MKTFYLSLSNGLSGYYVVFKAEREELVRTFAKENFGTMWLCVYSEAYFREILRRRYPNATRVVNRDRPIILQEVPGGTE